MFFIMRRTRCTVAPISKDIYVIGDALARGEITKESDFHAAMKVILDGKAWHPATSELKRNLEDMLKIEFEKGLNCSYSAIGPFIERNLSFSIDQNLQSEAAWHLCESGVKFFFHSAANKAQTSELKGFSEYLINYFDRTAFSDLGTLFSQHRKTDKAIMQRLQQDVELRHTITAVWLSKARDALLKICHERDAVACETVARIELFRREGIQSKKKSIIGAVTATMQEQKTKVDPSGVALLDEVAESMIFSIYHRELAPEVEVQPSTQKI